MMHDTMRAAPYKVFDALWGDRLDSDGCAEWANRFCDANTRCEAWFECQNGTWMLRVLVAMYAIGNSASLTTIHAAAVAAAKTASVHLFESDDAARSANVSRVVEIDDAIDRDAGVTQDDPYDFCRYLGRNCALQAMRWALQTSSASTTEELKDAVDGAAYFAQFAAVAFVPVRSSAESDAEVAAITDARERAYGIRQREIADAIRATVSIDDITDGEE